MGKARMAGSILRQLKTFGLPSSAGEAAMRFGPDIGFSALYAATVPQGYAEGGERVGLFAEDMLTQTLPGVLGSAVVGTAARRMGASPMMARQLAGGADMMGSIAGPMLAGPLGLRPVSRSLDERAAKNAELQRQLELEGAFAAGANSLMPGLGSLRPVQTIDQALYG
jgi:hypothetical protein